MTFHIITGNCLDVLRELDAESVHCVVSSPPYWGLRDYGIPPTIWQGDPDCEHAFVDELIEGELRRGIGLAELGKRYRGGGKKAAEVTSICATRGFCMHCAAWRGNFGLEPTPDLFIDHLVLIFEEVRRVLRKDGTLWLNLGDSYYSPRYNGGVGENSTINGQDAQEEYRKARKRRVANSKTIEAADFVSPHRAIAIPGLKAKDLVGIPWMAAFALRRAGWYLRRDHIWFKPNPMPESTPDRCTTAHEYLFHLSKSEHYYFDQEAIKEDASDNSHPRKANGAAAPMVSPKSVEHGLGIKANESFHAAVGDLVSKRNKRSVWTVATQPFAEAHFACVDAETEALTPDGWKRQDHLIDGEMIAAYDRGIDALVWQPAKFHRYPFDGELIAIEKRDSSQRLTPNHRCLVRRRVGGIAVVEAAALKPSMSILTTAVLWRAIDDGGPGDDFAALLGWYLTEGERRRGRIIRISQSLSANPRHVETIRALLNRLNAEFTEHTRTRSWRGRPSIEATFSVRGPVADALEAHSPDKKIDLAWLNWPKSAVQSLLDAIIDGDGHRRPDGRACVVQKDRLFLDAVQILALRLGWRAHVSKRKDGGHILYATKGDWLTLRSTDGKHTPIGKSRYVGTVWCPAVASTFWIARRKGRTFITGNTFPPALIEPCILAGTSERGCCPTCMTGWKRITAPTARYAALLGHGFNDHEDDDGAGMMQSRGINRQNAMMDAGMTCKETETIGWYPSCKCAGMQKLPKYPRAPSTKGLDEATRETRLAPWRAECARITAERRVLCKAVEKFTTKRAVVLDPFGGAGTTALVADRLQRDSLIIELNADYAEIARRRIIGDAPLFATAAE